MIFSLPEGPHPVIWEGRRDEKIMTHKVTDLTPVL